MSPPYALCTQSASVEEQCCSPRRYSWGQALTGRVWPAVNPCQLPARTSFLIWATHPGLVLKAPSLQWEKEQQHKAEVCSQDTSISSLPLFWSMDFLLMETVFNYYLINNFCAVQNFRSGWGITKHILKGSVSKNWFEIKLKKEKTQDFFFLFSLLFVFII